MENSRGKFPHIPAPNHPWDVSLCTNPKGTKGKFVDSLLPSYPEVSRFLTQLSSLFQGEKIWDVESGTETELRYSRENSNSKGSSLIHQDVSGSHKEF